MVNILEEAESSFIEGEELEILPCESPLIEDWGTAAAVYGRSDSKTRTASTAVNRIEFSGDYSTLRPTVAIMEPMEADSFNGYRMNCQKKKKKVLGLIERFNKDSISCVQHKDIYKDKLKRIDDVVEETLEYIDELLIKLELNEETERIADINLMRSEIVQSANNNEREVIEKVQSVLNSSSAAPAQMVENLTAPVTREGSETGVSSIRTDVVPKLTLRYHNIIEDVTDLEAIINGVKAVDEMTDVEVTYFVRKIDSWNDKLKTLVSAYRKFQEEAVGNVDLQDMVTTAGVRVKSAKILIEAKATALTKEDDDRGLNSLCENKNKSAVVFPEPFKGDLGENIFKFKREIVSAIKDTQVKKADQVRTLLKYLKGDARNRVGDYQPDLNIVKLAQPRFS